MIRVAVPTRYSVPTGLRYTNRPDGLMWFAATNSALIPPNSFASNKQFTNMDALYPQIEAEFRYNGNDDSDFALFPCRKECKQKTGGKGQAFKECLRECRGKGPKKSQLKGMEAQNDAELTEALNKLSQPTDDSSSRTSGSGKTTLYIILAIVVIAIIAISVWLVKKNKQ